MAARKDIDRLKVEIEDLFADLWQVPRFFGVRSVLRPQVDCYRTEDPPELIVVVELPGVDPGGVRIDAFDQMLVISGERRRPRVQGRIYQQMEIDYGPFERRIPLPEGADTAGARAEYERGLLTIVVPVAAKASPGRKVSIEVRTHR